MWVFKLRNNLAFSGRALILSFHGWPEEWFNQNFCLQPVRVVLSSAQDAACLSASTAAQHVSALPPSQSVITSPNYFNFILIILQPTYFSTAECMLQFLEWEIHFWICAGLGRELVYYIKNRHEVLGH
jgi:hypothetical protein